MFKKVIALAGVALFICFAIYVCDTLIEQRKTLEQIRLEKERLIERYNELERERELVQGMIDYTDSEEFLLRYARENLGYLFSDDVRFRIDVDEGGD